MILNLADLRQSHQRLDTHGLHSLLLLPKAPGPSRSLQPWGAEWQVMTADGLTERLWGWRPTPAVLTAVSFPSPGAPRRLLL